MNKIKQLIQKLEREKEPIDKLMLLQQMNKELELIKKDAKFRKQYPLAAERLDTLEKNSHPCKELHEFDAYPKLISRIEELEKNIKK